MIILFLQPINRLEDFLRDRKFFPENLRGKKIFRKIVRGIKIFRKIVRGMKCFNAFLFLLVKKKGVRKFQRDFPFLLKIIQEPRKVFTPKITQGTLSKVPQVQR